MAQHLQGVLLHRKSIKVYRTFHNIKNSANFQIYSFLSTIEGFIQENDCNLPDTIYYKVDGGSENTAKVMYGIAELLVKGVVVNLFIARLPVGHTHVDIDSKCSIIFK